MKYQFVIFAFAVTAFATNTAMAMPAGAPISVHSPVSVTSPGIVIPISSSNPNSGSTYVPLAPKFPAMPTTTINVKTLGAKGDGKTDDTEAIKTAIRSNAVILFPPGKYEFSGNLVFQSLTNARIVATGATFENTNLTTDDFVFLNGREISVTGGTYLRKTPVSTSENTAQTAFNFRICTNVQIENVTIDGSPGMGITIVNSTQVAALNNTVRNTMRDGIYSENSVNVLYQGNHLENIKDDALSMHDYGKLGTDNTYGKFRIVNLGYPQAGYSLITKNTTLNSARGIVSIGTKNLTISENSTSETAGPGVIVFNTEESYVGPSSRANHISILNNHLFHSGGSVTVLGHVLNNGSQGGNARAALVVGSFDSNYQIITPTRMMNGQISPGSRLSDFLVQGNSITQSYANGVLLQNIDRIDFNENTSLNCNLGPSTYTFWPSGYTGDIVEFDYSTGVSAFQNKVIDDQTPITHSYGATVRQSTGFTGQWTIEHYLHGDYRALAGPALQQVASPASEPKSEALSEE
jgi:hypothetical protein